MTDFNEKKSDELFVIALQRLKDYFFIGMVLSFFLALLTGWWALNGDPLMVHFFWFFTTVFLISFLYYVAKRLIFFLLGYDDGSHRRFPSIKLAINHIYSTLLLVALFVLAIVLSILFRK